MAGDSAESTLPPAVPAAIKFEPETKSDPEKADSEGDMEPTQVESSTAKVEASHDNVAKDDTTKDEAEKYAEVAKELENTMPFKKSSPEAKLVQRVSEFMKKLEPWKGIMPASLLEDMSSIEGFKTLIADEESPPEPPTEQFVCEVKKGSMQDWIKKDFSPLPPPPPPLPGSAPIPPPPPPTPPHVIEAFYRRNYQSSSAKLSRETGGQGAKLKSETGGPDGAAILSNDSKELQRICINSEILRSELESVTGVAVSHSGVPVIFAPPYKFFLPFLPDIKDRLTELEEELRKADPTGDDKNVKDIEDPTEATEDEVAPGPSAEVDEKKNNEQDVKKSADRNAKPDKTDTNTEDRKSQETRLSHLKLLYDLVQDDLKDLIKTRAEIADGTLKSIAFEDLWHLYKPGDIIVSTDMGRRQLYKVYSVTGGQIQRRTLTGEDVIEMQNARLRTRRPGEEEDDSDVALLAESSGIGTWTSLRVDCYNMVFDGTKYGPNKTCKKMKHYVGDREITRLPFCPLRFDPNKEEILREMEDRGRRFLASLGHKSYEGMSIALRRNDPREEIESDVYVDFESYYKQVPQYKPQLGWLLKSKAVNAESSEHVTGHVILHSGHEVDVRLAEDFMAANRSSLEPQESAKLKETPELLQLLPHQVVGYVFRSRAWFFMDVDLLKGIEEDESRTLESGFEDLVIPKSHRDLLVALVDNHRSGLQRKQQKLKEAKKRSAITQIDLVRGKGLGLIILLHGPPGSGKTSTAETIAAYTKRPLYSITCGDLGLAPEIVEARLRLHTQQADKWGCVLLLDEADVFLMQRSWRDLDRNALVSVFLRQLEYYSGILFLTTNRPGVIDEAFKSRIHVSLRYPPIDLEGTKTMWANIMNRIEQDNKTAEVKVNFDKEVLMEFAEKHYKRHDESRTTWNGRQIRNAFQTALALAHYDRLVKLRENGISVEEAAASGKKKWMTVKLTKAIFQKIAKTARDFELYIEMIRGKDSDRIRDEELRDDYNDPTARPARKQYPSSPSIRRVATPEPSSGASARKGKKAARKDIEDEDESDDAGDETDEEEISDDDDE